MMTASKKFVGVKLNHLKNGDITYYITYKAGNRTVYKKVGKRSEGINELKAKNLRSEIISQIRHGQDMSQKSQSRITFDDLAEIYFRSNQSHNKSNHNMQLMYNKHIKPSFGDVVFSLLDDQLVYELQQLKICDELSKATVNVIVKLIRRIVGFAIKRGVITYSPFKNLKLYKVDNTRLRYLSKEEIVELKNEVEGNKLLKLFVHLALSTGARAKSVLSIRKKDIDFTNKTISIYDFKRGTHYVGYADIETFKMIKSVSEHLDINSFIVSLDGKETEYQTIYKHMSVIFKKLYNHNLSKRDKHKVVIHTLRHTFASHLAIAGVPLQEIQKLMNHKDINQTLKYAKLMPHSGKQHIENLYKD